MIIIDNEKIKVILLLVIIIIGFITYIACMIYAFLINNIDLIVVGLFIAVIAIAASTASIMDRR